MDYYGIDISEDQEVRHYGVLKKSGRYPWGSGESPNQRNKDFLAYIDDLKRKGLSDVEIAKGIGEMDKSERFNTSQLRASKAIAKNEVKAAQIAQAVKLSNARMSNVAIGKEMGIPESTVRTLLAPDSKMKNEKLFTSMDILKDQVKEKTYLDIGAGTEILMGVSDTHLKTAVAGLKEEGYEVHYVKVKQLGTGNFTTHKVLVPPGTTHKDTFRDQGEIKTYGGAYSEDGGHSFKKILPPVNMKASRIEVRYGDEGGSEMDGTLQVRRGVDDISLGNARYAQVRVAVEGGRYLKGMAMYADDLPDGVDIRFNTNKLKKNLGDDPLAAMKKQEADPDRPFGAEIKRQITYSDAKGKEKQGAMNIVNEEGDWGEWSKSLSSQMLSKQQPSLAKTQLDLTYSSKKEAFDEIMSLSNPEVKRKMMAEFADSADAASVHLKAASLPRQGTHVILPINQVKETEIYAPNYRDGEKVVLVRYPHGGKFEIPELTVNNKSRIAKSILGVNPKDAVGINSKVAERLSGADFDGDTVLVIPNNQGRIKNKPPLEGLKGFDPQRAYPQYEGMRVMSPRTKQIAMGDVSNLITDMSIMGASDSELARAVRHSMVVIDAEKHKLNYRQSAQDNGISDLKRKYQGDARNGGQTVISRASSEIDVRKRRARRANEGGNIDPLTGKKMYTETGEGYTVPEYIRTSPKGKQTLVPERFVYKTEKSTKMAETDDAYSLSSGTAMESVYAAHANKLKKLGNDARLAVAATPRQKRNSSAAETYSTEVKTLTAKLNVALKNAPRERQAQVLANALVAAKKRARPDMDKDDIKKEESKALTDARIKTGAKKDRIVPTAKEWEAIQASAISGTQLQKILANADMDAIKALATPRTTLTMTPAKTARAKAMLDRGYTQAEIAEALGVSTSLISNSVA